MGSYGSGQQERGSWGWGQQEGGSSGSGQQERGLGSVRGVAGSRYSQTQKLQHSSVGMGFASIGLRGVFCKNLESQLF